MEAAKTGRPRIYQNSSNRVGVAASNEAVEKIAEIKEGLGCSSTSQTVSMLLEEALKHVKIVEKTVTVQTVAFDWGDAPMG